MWGYSTVAAGYFEYGLIHVSGPHLHAHFVPRVLALTGELPAGARVPEVGA